MLRSKDATRRPTSGRHAVGIALATALLLSATACSSDSTDSNGSNDPATQSTAPIAAATTDADFKVQAGIGFVAVQGAEPGTTLVLGRERPSMFR